MTAQEDGKSQNENGIRSAAKIPGETPLSETSFLLPLKSDVIFKLVFGDPRYIDITKAFLSAILGIPADEFADLRIIDPHLERDRPGDKLGILDVRAQMKSGKLISVEIQVRRTPFMAERVAFSTGRNLSRQIAPGQNYKKKWKCIRWNSQKYLTAGSGISARGSL